VRTPETGRRTAAVLCPDWSLTAAGVSPATPAAIVRDDLVTACTAAARDEGVHSGQKRRDAQRACPALLMLPDDPLRDGGEFCRVVTAVADLVPRVEVVQPGLLAFPASGAARYHGSEHVLAERVVDAAAAASGGECWVGVADGLFAAALAARRGVLVPPGRTPAFLADHPVGVLGRPDLADLLKRLGLRTLGEFAGLPAAAVLARFGPDGAVAHRLARGLDERPVAPSRPPPELAVVAHLDPPLASVDAAAFAVRPLAEELHERLSRRGLVCTLLSIEAETEDGAVCERMWRHGSYSAAAVVDRLRWQLEGWLTAGGRGQVTLLRLAPEEVLRAGGEQLDLSGDDPEAAARMARAVARVQGLLGPYAVTVPVPAGGRDPATRLAWVPWDDAQPATALPPPTRRHPGAGDQTRHHPRPEPALPQDTAWHPGAGDQTRHHPRPEPALPQDTAWHPGAGDQTRHHPRPEPALPWPGGIPAPYPATVYPTPLPAALLDSAGATVRVDGRGELSERPARLATGGGAPVPVTDWGGPWPADEWWWDPARHRRRARMQVSTVDGRAFLLACTEGRWLVEAEYD